MDNMQKWVLGHDDRIRDADSKIATIQNGMENAVAQLTDRHLEFCKEIHTLKDKDAQIGETLAALEEADHIRAHDLERLELDLQYQENMQECKLEHMQDVVQDFVGSNKEILPEASGPVNRTDIPSMIGGAALPLGIGMDTGPTGAGACAQASACACGLALVSGG